MEGKGRSKCPGPERSVVGRQQRGDRAAVAVLDKPKGLRLRRVFKDLQGVDAVVKAGECLEDREAMRDSVAV